MLAIPENANTMRLLSIDPGTTTTGLAFYEVNLVNKQIHLVDALTIKASTNFGNYKRISILHSDRLARVLYLSDLLYQFLLDFQPNAVICESSFMGSFPDAFEGLIHCVSLFETMMLKYNERIPMEMIDPTSVKRNLNAILKNSKGGTESKDSVRKKILELHDNKAFTSDVDLTKLDEHSIDAVAIGWFKITQTFEVYYGQRYYHHKNSYRSFDTGAFSHSVLSLQR